MTVMTPKFGLGASVLRTEDNAFITGKGRYTDDISPDGVLHGYVLRSRTTSPDDPLVWDWVLGLNVGEPCITPSIAATYLISRARSATSPSCVRPR